MTPKRTIVGLWALGVGLRVWGLGPRWRRAGVQGSGWRAWGAEFGMWGFKVTQILQNPIIREYTLTYNRNPNMIEGIFLH